MNKKTMEELKRMDVSSRLDYINANWFEDVRTESSVAHGLRSDLTEEEKELYRQSVKEYWTADRMKSAIGS